VFSEIYGRKIKKDELLGDVDTDEARKITVEG